MLQWITRMITTSLWVSLMRVMIIPALRGIASLDLKVPSWWTYLVSMPNVVTSQLLASEVGDGDTM